jgi:hypothetical protein
MDPSIPTIQCSTFPPLQTYFVPTREIRTVPDLVKLPREQQQASQTTNAFMTRTKLTQSRSPILQRGVIPGKQRVQSKKARRQRQNTRLVHLGNGEENRQGIHTSQRSSSP